jgi:hypothetical protein
VTTQARRPGFSSDPAAPLSSLGSPLHSSRPEVSQTMVHSVQFVATPKAALVAPTAIQSAVTQTLNEVTGFRGCLVMISDQEKRLVTVLTFWFGENRSRYCNENVSWIYRLIAPYLDHFLRAQTLSAYLPAPSESPIRSQTLDQSPIWDLAMERDPVCVE